MAEETKIPENQTTPTQSPEEILKEAAAGTRSYLVTENTIFGLPYGSENLTTMDPTGYDLLRQPDKSLMVLELTPCLLSSLAHVYLGATTVGLQRGLASKEYQQLMAAFNINLPIGKVNKIKIALSSIPTIAEQFDNTIAPHWLISMVAGESAAGGNNPANKAGMINLSKQIFGDQAIDNLINGLGNIADMVLPRGATEVATARASGAQINVPNVWNSSSKGIQYDFEIKLYNFGQNSEVDFFRNIYTPLMLIMGLTLPRKLAAGNGENYGPDFGTFGSSELTQRNPFYVQAEVKGYFRIRAGIIRSLSILKGGMERSFGYNGRPNIIDIRLSITDLMPSLVNATTSHLGIGGSLVDYSEDLLQTNINDIMSLQDAEGEVEVPVPEATRTEPIPGTDGLSSGGPTTDKPQPYSIDNSSLGQGFI